MSIGSKVAKGVVPYLVAEWDSKGGNSKKGFPAMHDTAIKTSGVACLLIGNVGEVPSRIVVADKVRRLESELKKNRESIDGKKMFFQAMSATEGPLSLQKGEESSDSEASYTGSSSSSSGERSPSRSSSVSSVSAPGEGIEREEFSDLWNSLHCAINNRGVVIPKGSEIFSSSVFGEFGLEFAKDGEWVIYQAKGSNTFLIKGERGTLIFSRNQREEDSILVVWKCDESVGEYLLDEHGIEGENTGGSDTPTARAFLKKLLALVGDASSKVVNTQNNGDKDSFSQLSRKLGEESRKLSSLKNLSEELQTVFTSKGIEGDDWIISQMGSSEDSHFILEKSNGFRLFFWRDSTGGLFGWRCFSEDDDGKGFKWDSQKGGKFLKALDVWVDLGSRTSSVVDAKVDGKPTRSDGTDMSVRQGKGKSAQEKRNERAIAASKKRWKLEDKSKVNNKNEENKIKQTSGIAPNSRRPLKSLHERSVRSDKPYPEPLITGTPLESNLPDSRGRSSSVRKTSSVISSNMTQSAQSDFKNLEEEVHKALASFSKARNKGSGNSILKLKNDLKELKTKVGNFNGSSLNKRNQEKLKAFSHGLGEAIASLERLRIGSTAFSPSGNSSFPTTAAEIERVGENLSKNSSQTGSLVRSDTARPSSLGTILGEPAIDRRNSSTGSSNVEPLVGPSATGRVERKSVALPERETMISNELQEKLQNWSTLINLIGGGKYIDIDALERNDKNQSAVKTLRSFFRNRNLGDNVKIEKSEDNSKIILTSSSTDLSATTAAEASALQSTSVELSLQDVDTSVIEALNDLLPLVQKDEVLVDASEVSASIPPVNPSANPSKADLDPQIHLEEAKNQPKDADVYIVRKFGLYSAVIKLSKAGGEELKKNYEAIIKVLKELKIVPEDAIGVSVSVAKSTVSYTSGGHARTVNFSDSLSEPALASAVQNMKTFCQKEAQSNYSSMDDLLPPLHLQHSRLFTFDEFLNSSKRTRTNCEIEKSTEKDEINEERDSVVHNYERIRKALKETGIKESAKEFLRSQALNGDTFAIELAIRAKKINNNKSVDAVINDDFAAVNAFYMDLMKQQEFSKYTGFLRGFEKVGRSISLFSPFKPTPEQEQEGKEYATHTAGLMSIARSGEAGVTAYEKLCTDKGVTPKQTIINEGRLLANPEGSKKLKIELDRIESESPADTSDVDQPSVEEVDNESVADSSGTGESQDGDADNESNDGSV